MDFTKKNILLEVPQEIFELICDQLPILSVMTLELVSKSVHERLGNSMVWKKKAEKITRKFKYQPLNHMMKFLKEKGNSSANVNTKLYKIVIGKYSKFMYLFMFTLSLSIINIILPFTTLYLFIFSLQEYQHICTIPWSIWRRTKPNMQRNAKSTLQT